MPAQNRTWRVAWLLCPLWLLLLFTAEQTHTTRAVIDPCLSTSCALSHACPQEGHVSNQWEGRVCASSAPHRFFAKKSARTFRGSISIGGKSAFSLKFPGWNLWPISRRLCFLHGGGTHTRLVIRSCIHSSRPHDTSNISPKMARIFRHLKYLHFILRLLLLTKGIINCQQK